MGLATYLDKVRRYYPFTFLEIRNIMITIILIGFMYGFNDGRPKFETIPYFYNMLVSMGVAAITVLVFVSGQRFAGISAGYRVEFQMWWPGMVVALIITFIARGWIWIPIAGGMLLHHMSGHRLGFFRYGLNMLDNGIIASCGPLACVVYATIVKQIAVWTNLASLPIINKMYWFALVFAVVNMLPIPPLAGSKLMYNSRAPYVFIFAFILAYAVMAYFNLFSWILALILAFVLWVLYYIRYEQ